MEKHSKKNTSVGLTEANEKSITKENLLKEILPLLKEYFIGSFKIENGDIKMTFLNGQEFELTVGEVGLKDLTYTEGSARAKERSEQDLTE